MQGAVLSWLSGSGITMGGGESGESGGGGGGGRVGGGGTEFWKNRSPFEASGYKMFKYWHAPLEKVVHPLVPPENWTLVTPLLSGKLWM